MYYIIQILLSIASTATAATIVEPMSNYYQYTQFQTPLSWEAISSSSLEQAMTSCQESFKWQRWNCPSHDFIKRRTDPPIAQEMDREDVYVTAIATAAILHKLTRDCANGIIAGCGCSENVLNVPCAHEPEKALQLYQQRYGVGTGAVGHNQRVVGALMKQSLELECHCKQHNAQGNCLKEQCVPVLKSFEAIAQDLLHMYDDAIQLDTTTSNLKIMWQNIPLDSFVYMQDSPNYCQPEENNRWAGTLGRQCSKHSGSGTPADERLSCQQLCRVCGFRVRSQHVRNERRCNCKLVWGFRLQCDACIQLERQYSCF
ncbi:wnt inhibitor of Dorsal protein [Drosophila grimshawi]|uniref:Protein Wnt n=1 Tax=Drosophila grimshawi TaxID=7222 RepID=B4JEL9_DROGR|nr:wnt inhibitor of Dorsal protein [Drosophila grimshawi]EDV93150.1 GH19146 [Drosophila grimshawi]